ncbi:hypothetical protein KY284_012604 [Solanum tuberosum]|nr:hypothetical protein KY284_012604 [Solanum tuberosum]
MQVMKVTKLVQEKKSRGVETPPKDNNGKAVDGQEKASDKYDSEDNHSENNDGQDVEVLPGDDQSIDNSKNSTPANTSIDGTNEVQLPNVQLDVDFSNWLNIKHTDLMETSVNENEGAEDNVEGHHMVTRHKAKKMSITHTSLAAKKLSMEPTTVKQALASPHWHEAMQEEVDALHKNHTWTLIPRTCDRETIFLLLYLDDIIITSSSSDLIANIITGNGRKFAMKDLVPLHFFLGVEVRYFKDGIHLNQGKYVIELLMKTDMARAKAVSTPLAQKMVYNRSQAIQLMSLRANCISWASKKQHTVSRSSAEAQYRAFSSTAAEITWITYILRDIGVYLKTTPTLFCDNISALYMTATPVLHARTKHVEMDYHFVREKVARGHLVTHFIRSKDQLAGIHTKALTKKEFTKF